MAKQPKKLGTLALTAIVLSAMLGGGIFSLPQNMAEGASQGGVMIAWGITAIGMGFITNTLQTLSEKRNDLTTGLYGYAEEGFGKFAGFISAFGYWLSNCFSLVAYAVLMMATLGYFFPVLGEGNTMLATVLASVLTWGLYFITLRGMEESSFLNNIGTIGKLLVIALFILAMVGTFSMKQFESNMWGQASRAQIGGLPEQTASTMLITLWLFLGIEGAVVISNRAKSARAVKQATLLGFVAILVIYILASLLPYGVFSQQELAQMSNPSMAVIMENLWGHSGAVIINIGILIAVSSSWLTWLVLVSEMPAIAAEHYTFPKYFMKKNDKGAYDGSLLVSTIIIQIMLIVAHFFENAWGVMINITASMALPCYLFATLYLCKLSFNHNYFPTNKARVLALITGVCASIYAVWLIYAANLMYLVVAILLYVLGLPLYFKARKQQALS